MNDPGRLFLDLQRLPPRLDSGLNVGLFLIDWLKSEKYAKVLRTQRSVKGL